MGVEANFNTVSPLKIRCFSLNKNKQRRSVSKLFNAAHKLKNNETYLSSNLSEFRHLSKSP
jgi:hypothetical protein